MCSILSAHNLCIFCSMSSSCGTFINRARIFLLHSFSGNEERLTTGITKSLPLNKKHQCLTQVDSSCEIADKHDVFFIACTAKVSIFKRPDRRLKMPSNLQVMTAMLKQCK